MLELFCALAILAFLWLVVPRHPDTCDERWQVAITLFTQHHPRRAMPKGYECCEHWEPFAAAGVWVYWRRKLRRA